ncbi:hypothetical protein EHQ13_07355 [Leptospira gomenensis]|uniref:Uncharacterized protein n=2 Tax=Leptospira gomenensis TaxID=2484974 RepID=A0A5F1Y7A0_9LEPT|nr:hypothetical protein [Leptospira gomenensis]TGK29479.1 hypothetical protein EHQ17_16020 [Leptospira gomenensis]TGK44859.1 hypothetical protein EHQ07_11270 [Leptospira gomenensis]TGK64480.1 hypothetical protein EHQ13_07355 [Leptospira gomenensis]
MIRNSEWIFYRDGRGRKVERSLREGETSSEFFWRKNSEYSIEIRGPEPEAEWRTICYDFRAISTDVGLLPALVEIDETGNILNEFGVLEVPLSFVEDTENDTIGSGVPEED